MSQALIDFFGLGVGVRAVEHHDLAAKLGLLQDAEKVFLRAAGFGEDEGLLLKSGPGVFLLCLGGGGETSPQGRQKDLALGIRGDGAGQGVKLAELGHFLPHVGDLLGRVLRSLGLAVAFFVRFPFVGQFVDFLPVVGQLFRRGVHLLGLGRRRFRA